MNRHFEARGPGPIAKEPPCDSADLRVSCCLSWRLVPIGVVRTSVQSIEEPPSHFTREGLGTVEVFPSFEKGLKDIEGFSHLWLVTLFHESEGYEAEVVTGSSRSAHGVFTTRSARRPNPIGLSLVNVLRRDGPILHVAGIDLLDGTPLLDIKPFLPSLDCAGEPPRCGWFDLEETSD